MISDLDTTGLDPSVVLYLRMRGANASTLFPDESPSHKSFSVGSPAQITTTINQNAASPFVPNPGSVGSFDGSSAYIDTPANSDFSWSDGQGSVFAWVRLTGSSGNRYIICGSADNGGLIPSLTFILERYTDNKIRFGVAAGSSLYVAESAGMLNDTNWHWVGGAWIAGTIYAYLDGVAGTGVGTSGTMNSCTKRFSIGRIGEYNGFYWSGNIGEIISTKGRVIDGTVIPKAMRL